jgi:hypothetical protein
MINQNANPLTIKNVTEDSFFISKLDSWQKGLFHTAVPILTSKWLFKESKFHYFPILSCEMEVMFVKKFIFYNSLDLNS